MIWHIFKKDLKLLWLFAVAVAVVQFAIIAVHLKLGVFQEEPVYSSLLLLLESVMYLGVAVLIGSVVYQDSIVGLRQDWLVRPISRVHLLASKLLFLLLSVQLPMLFAAIAGGIANDFPLSQSFLAALSENLYFFIGFTLPIFALVSITRSISEALATAFAVFIGFMIMAETLILPMGGSPLGPTSDTSLSWIPLTWRFAIYLVAAVAILVLQYFRRATLASRVVLASAVLFCILTDIMPWNTVFAWQKAISHASVVANSVVVSFDPVLGRFQSTTPDSESAKQAEFSPVRRRETDEDTILYIPLQFTGIPTGSIVKVDRAVANIAMPGTTRQQTISSAGDPGEFKISNDDRPSSDPLTVFEVVHVRGNFYSRLKDTPVTLRLDYSATLLNLSSTRAIPAINADIRFPDLGHCETRLNDSRTAVEFRCVDVGNPADCTNVSLQDPATGLHNPSIFGCLDDYSPYFGRYKPPDSIMHAGANLVFRDPNNLLHYPVNASMVGSAQVLITNYSVAGHFSDQLTIPVIRLADWSAP